MSHNPSKLLLDQLDLLTDLDRSLPVLDLACGTGRNGLALAEQGMDVVFADKSVMSGGLVVYETFTTVQRKFGHPNNPDFLLRPGELKATFEDWQLIHQFEGIRPKPDRGIAGIVARKP
jgi:hypothetical protein